MIKVKKFNHNPVIFYWDKITLDLQLSRDYCWLFVGCTWSPSVAPRTLWHLYLFPCFILDLLWYYCISSSKISPFHISFISIVKIWIIIHIYLRNLTLTCVISAILTLESTKKSLFCFFKQYCCKSTGERFE